MNSQIHQEAAEWLIDLRVDEADATTRERFAAWLRISPEHVGAYLKLVSFWEDAGLYDSARKLDIESLIALACADANVIALEVAPRADSTSTDAPISSPLSFTGKIRHRLAVAAILTTLAVLAGTWFALDHRPSYATGVGEQRTVTLRDGSNVELNAVSRIRVRFSDRERAVELLAGQALFRVAKNKNRPFVVTSGDTRVRAVGTQFDVNRKRSQTIVTVIEGRVALLPRNGETPGAPSSVSALPVEIAAGEQVTVTARAIPQPRRANIVTATAWTQQQLIFESMSLPEVAEEFNRFNTRQLAIEGSALAEFHVSGTFAALDPASLPRFVGFLREQPGLHVVESGDRIVVTQK
jgi:transmembrane sensor